MKLAAEMTLEQLIFGLTTVDLEQSRDTEDPSFYSGELENVRVDDEITIFVMAKGEPGSKWRMNVWVDGKPLTEEPISVHARVPEGVADLNKEFPLN